MVSQTLKKTGLRIGVLAFYSVASVLSTTANDLTSRPLTAPAGEKRTIQFNSAKSLGTLFLGQINGHCSVGELKQVGPALGKVTVFVPKNLSLFYEPNALIFQQPKLMSGITPHGIDVLQLQALELDEEEKGNCDRVVEYVADRFKDLHELVVDTSDVSDDGLAHLKNMPNLEAISTLACHDIRGQCFSSLSKLPNLQRFNLRGHPLDKANLKYLAMFPKLTFLGLRSTEMNEAGVKDISRCSQLSDLDLSENGRVDDKCIAALGPLKHLRILDLHSTAVTDRGLPFLLRLQGLKSLSLNNTLVTPRGLAVLIPLKLEDLKLSAQYSRLDLTKIGPIASHVTFGVPAQSMDQDVRADFAPLH